ncbi:General transcription factor II-I repeat domain containing protein 2 [Dissostichus eleginoides]|uniref:General transcription factor II-I repeat domain containing protein 2 n=1 Tax=Dissostichus eleginoides TaxID=100907 RepID=A0AAD9BKC8_DISEL|nr:General transcription factor II-I repeat domain containing protein 2 [Dissostichus eleginoides]
MSNSDLNEVVATVVKIVNFIVKRSALTHRQFQSLLEEMDSSYKDLPLHSAFLAEKGQDFPELEDEKWVVKLMFLTDITGHLNELNLKLQGAGSCPRSTASANAEICKYISELESEFTTRFGEFQKYGPMFSFLIKPDSFDGHELDVSVIDWLDTQDMIMQLIELKSSTLWMTKFAELRKQLETTARHDHSTCIFTCWISLTEKFSCVRKIALALLTVFGSTYLCEQIFSHMKSVLSPSRSRLTTDHSEACVQLKVTKYDPQIMELSKGKQGQGSH